MRRQGAALLICLALFAFPCLSPAAGATTASVAMEYGAWSEWQAEEIQPSETLEIESAVMLVDEEAIRWSYRRFTYFNEQADQWYCSYMEQSGPHYKEGSGYWETNETEEPLKIAGNDGPETLYEGGWYYETPVRNSEPVEKTMYRSRIVRDVNCELSAKELLLLPGKQAKIEANLFDVTKDYRWTSSDEEIATVDQDGNVEAVALGSATITITSENNRVANCQVLVCEKGASIPNGVYSLRLGSSGMALNVGERIASYKSNLDVAEFTGAKTQRFELENVGKKTFVLHPLSSKKMFMDVVRGGKEPNAGDNVQVTTKKDKMAQYWRAIFVPDGSYILYPRSYDNFVLGAEPLEAGTNVRVEPMGDLSGVDRWVLVKTGNGMLLDTPYTFPVVRDGISYPSVEFHDSERKDHEGMDIGSNGRRVYVLSAMAGTVTKVSGSCNHDYEKKRGKDGNITDPCGKSSYGKYILIDHGNGLSTLYAHLSEIYVREGDEVKMGDLIGRSGTTGSSTAVHLHFELRQNGKAIDPRSYMSFPDKDQPIQ